MITNRFVHIIELIKTRRARLARRRSSPDQLAARAGWFSFALLGITAAILALGALPLYLVVTSNLPKIEDLEKLMDPISGDLLNPTKLYDQSGQTLILQLSPDGINRHFIESTAVPWFVRAYISSTQPDFWTEDAALLSQWTVPPETIPEQLVARVLLQEVDLTWIHSLRVHYLAMEILQKYSREQILTWAVNTIDFGHWAFGVESAAQLYFNKPASDLSLAESALLAAVAQAPALNPLDNPQLATQFQRLILTSMWEQGVITNEELTQATNEQLIFAQRTETQTATTDFTNLAIDQVEAELGHDALVRGNLVVTTTLDYSLQVELSNLMTSASREAAALVLDPLNDRVLAFTGDIHETHESVEILSPFSYLSAFANGKSPSSLVWDVTEEQDNSGSGPTTMRMALASHLTNVENSLLRDPVLQSIRTKLLEALNVEASEGNETNLLQAGRAFEIFPLNGLFPVTQTANALLFVSDPNGSVLLDKTNQQWHSVVSPEIAYLVTDVLADRTALESIHYPSRAAAFFTPPNSSWWFAFSPQRVVAIWDNKAFLAPETKLAVFSAAHQGLPLRAWEIPSGLSSVIVCVPSGQLPDQDCPQTRREWFVQGNEPLEYDDLYSRVTINSTNGKLATVFTPESFIQERTFIFVPEEAQLWAAQAGVSNPPTDYDPVAKIRPVASELSITRPARFNQVSGLTQIFGTLNAEAVRYDIQVGKGLYPNQWIQIAENRVTKLNGQLADWDTTGLSGIWAIQLQVWDQEGQLTRAYTVVTLAAEK